MQYYSHKLHDQRVNNLFQVNQRSVQDFLTIGNYNTNANSILTSTL